MTRIARAAAVIRLAAYTAAASVALAFSAPAQNIVGCDQLFAALDRQVATPYHAYLTTGAGTDVARNGGKPRHSEIIWTGTAKYISRNGKWVRLDMTPREMLQQEKETRQNPKFSAQCHRVADTALNGEPVTVWTSHSTTEVGVMDERLWISRGSGRVLQMELTEDVGGGAPGKTRMLARYDYHDVQPPRGSP